MIKTNILLIFLSFLLMSFSFRTGTFVLSSKNRTKNCTPNNAIASGTQTSNNFGSTYSTCSGFTCASGLAPSNGQCVSLGGNIQNFGTYRAWSDGTYASNCNSYKTATSPYSYAGATGDGVYRISDANGINDVFCAMALNASGWTRVAYIVSNSPVSYASYSTSSYFDNITDKGGSRQVYAIISRLGAPYCGNVAVNAYPTTNISVLQSCTITNAGSFSCKVNHTGLDGYINMNYTTNIMSVNNSNGYYTGSVTFSVGRLVATGNAPGTCANGTIYEFFIR